MNNSEERLNSLIKTSTKPKTTRRDSSKPFSNLRMISDSKTKRLTTSQLRLQFLRRKLETFKIDKSFLASNATKDPFKLREYHKSLSKLIERSS